MRDFDPGTSPTAVLEPLLAEFPAELFADSIHQSTRIVDRYGLEWALTIAHDLELEKHLTVATTAQQICADCGYPASFRPALEWVLGRLAETDWISCDAAAEPSFEVAQPLPAAELASIRQLGLEIDPENRRCFDLFDLAGTTYPRVARREITGESALASPSSIRLWLDYFSNTNPVYGLNNLLSAWAAVNRLTQLQRPARVLEVGAGAGSAARALLRVDQKLADNQLAGQRAAAPTIGSYTFSEPQTFFRRQAERQLSGEFPQVEFSYSALDIDQPWQPQLSDLSGEPFDLVLGVNVFHVANDLRFSLAEALGALAPGGWLVLGECLRPFPDQTLSVEMMFQLLESFQTVRTDPEYRPRHGFLTPENWNAALAPIGFTKIEHAPEIARIRNTYRYFQAGAICAQRSV